MLKTKKHKDIQPQKEKNEQTTEKKKSSPHHHALAIQASKPLIKAVLVVDLSLKMASYHITTQTQNGPNGPKPQWKASENCTASFLLGFMKLHKSKQKAAKLGVLVYVKYIKIVLLFFILQKKKKTGQVESSNHS